MAAPDSTTTTNNDDTDDVDLSATLAGRVTFDVCLCNASGPRCTSLEELELLAAQPWNGGIVTKSAAAAPAPSDISLPTAAHYDEWHTEFASFNTVGLPPHTVDYYLDPDHVRRIRQAATNDNNNNNAKPYIVSIAYKSLGETADILQRIINMPDPDRALVSAVELNISVPTHHGQPILAYNVEELRRVLERLYEKFGKIFKDAARPMPLLGLKLPPYLDPTQIERVANLINRYNSGSLWSFVTCTNAMGNCLPIQVATQQTCVGNHHGFAALSGPALHALAVANVRTFRQSLRPSVDVVGVGGVSTGHDVIAMVLAGASVVQMGTVVWKDGPAECFPRVAQETKAWLREHGFRRIQDVQGKLRPWSPVQTPLPIDLSIPSNNKTTTTEETQKSKAGAAESTSRVVEIPVSTSAPKTGNELETYILVSAVLILLASFLIAEMWQDKVVPSE